MRLVESFVLLVAKLHGAKNDIHKEILHHRLGGLAEITWFDSPAGQLVLGLEVVVLLVALDGFEYQDLPVLSLRVAPRDAEIDRVIWTEALQFAQTYRTCSTFWVERRPTLVLDLDRVLV